MFIFVFSALKSFPDLFSQKYRYEIQAVQYKSLKFSKNFHGL